MTISVTYTKEQKDIATKSINSLIACLPRGEENERLLDILLSAKKLASNTPMLK